MGIKYLYIVLFLGSISLIRAQSPSSAIYEEGKHLLVENKYYQAASRFEQFLLREDPPFPQRNYAHLYHAVALCEVGSTAEALSKLRLLRQDYPTFEPNITAYWQGKCLVNKDPKKALYLWEEMENAVLKTRALAALCDSWRGRPPSLSGWAAAHALHPHDSCFKKAFQGYVLQHYDEAFSDSLAQYFPHAREWLLMSEKYDASTRRVAVLLPFSPAKHDSHDPYVLQNNTMVMDLYKGMRLAEEKVREEGVALKVNYYDTKRRANTVRSILQQPFVQDAQAVVGPLYPETIPIALAFSKRHQKTLINPLSNNPRNVKGNPYAFLLQAHYRRQNQVLADYVEQNLDNKHIFIFYENTAKDEMMAMDYAEKMVREGFVVPLFLELDVEIADIIGDILTEAEYVKVEEDSLESFKSKELPYHLLRQHTSQYGDTMHWYAETWNVAPDSVGHVVLFATSSLLATHTLTSLHTRPDTIPLFLPDKWLYRTDALSLEHLEKDYVHFVSPFLFPKSEERTRFVQNFRSTYASFPSHYAYVGYESLLFLARLMKKPNQPLYNSLLRAPFPSTLRSNLYQFYPHNSNQVVHIVRFHRGRSRVVYRSR